MPIQKMRYEEINPPAETPSPAKKKPAVKVEKTAATPATPSTTTPE